MAAETGLHQIHSGTEKVLDVVFVHGLDGHYLETWRPRRWKNGDWFWPQWLADQNPNWGVWLLEYPVHMRRPGSGRPLRAIARQVLPDMARLGDLPIIFISHSLGGLLVVELLHIGH